MAVTAGVPGGVADDRPRATSQRSRWRSVAVPSEHGGWGLTAEPALLGLLVAPSIAGGVLAVAAVVTFLARTPLKLVLVDCRRRRRLPRTQLASRVLAAEIAVLAGCALAASLVARAPFWWPLFLAAPLVIVELSFDMRSRSRRLVPELAGTAAIAAVAPMIVLADGRSARLATALWIVMVARSVASMPFVRLQIDRLRHGPRPVATSDRAQGAAVLLAVTACLVDAHVLTAMVIVAVMAGLHLVWIRRAPRPARVLGLRETALGAGLVLGTALGVLLG